MQFSLNNDLSELERLATQLEAFGEAEELPPQLVQHLNLALDELVTNTINYGYKQSECGQIDIVIVRKDNQVEVSLRDRGKPFDPFSADEPDIKASVDDRPIGGLGVFLVRKLMDSWSYRREGEQNVVCLTKKI